MSIGTYRQIILEKWTQEKNDKGSLTDTAEERTRLWAEVKRTGGSRSYEHNQTQMSNTYQLRIRHNNLSPNGLYKVVYKGSRHTVLSIESIDEKRFNYLLTVESK